MPIDQIRTRSGFVGRAWRSSLNCLTERTTPLSSRLNEASVAQRLFVEQPKHRVSEDHGFSRLLNLNTTSSR